MADNIDMWKDIEDYEQDPLISEEFIQDLHDCFNARYIEGNLQQAEEFKLTFESKYKFWGNWY